MLHNIVCVFIYQLIAQLKMANFTNKKRMLGSDWRGSCVEGNTLERSPSARY